jgi:chitinase
MRSTLLHPGLPTSSRCWRWLSVFVVPALIALSLIPTALSPSAQAAPSSSGGGGGAGGGALPAHLLMGYWQDFTNGATPLALASVPATYNLVAVAFGNAGSTPGQVTFSLDPGLSSALGGYSASQFTSDIQTLHARGQKVILSVGGQNGTVSVSDAASASNFASSVDSIVKQYGFDGVDIDLENGVNPTYMASALQQLQSDVGSSLIITLAPQTVDTQSAGSDYLALALNIKSILTMISTQYYNSGTMNGCDGNVYAEGTENFMTALACTELQSGLSASQIGLGLPASSSAAGSGYVAPALVNSALDCLAAKTNCGSFVPPAAYPAIRGVMTWSINWDAANGYNFADTVAPHLASLP